MVLELVVVDACAKETKREREREGRRESARECVSALE
jgi:hypothetical protein